MTVVNQLLTVNLTNTGTGGVSGFTVSGSYLLNGVTYQSGHAVTNSSGSATFFWVLSHAAESGTPSMWYVTIIKGSSTVYETSFSSQRTGTLAVTINCGTSTGGSGGSSSQINVGVWDSDPFHTAYKMAENRNDVPSSLILSSFTYVGHGTGAVVGVENLAGYAGGTRYYTYWLASDSQSSYDGTAICTTSPSAASSSGTLSSALSSYLYSTSSFVTGLMKSKIVYTGTNNPRYLAYRRNASTVAGSDTGWCSYLMGTSAQPTYWHRIEFDPNGGEFTGLPSVPSLTGTNDIFYTFDCSKIACTHKISSSSYTWTLSQWQPTPVRDGYQFVGWATSSASGSSTITTKATSVSATTYSPVTLYAMWEMPTNWVADSTNRAYCEYNDRTPAVTGVESYKFEGGSSTGYSLEIKAFQLSGGNIMHTNEFYIYSSTQSTYDGVAICKSVPTSNSSATLSSLLSSHLYSSNSYVTGVQSKVITVDESNLTNNMVYVVYRRNNSTKANENAGYVSFLYELGGGINQYNFRLVLDANGGTFAYRGYSDSIYYNLDHTRVYYEEAQSLSQGSSRTFTLSNYGNTLNSRSGYTFKGWALTANAGSSGVLSTVVAESDVDKILYAVWEEDFPDPNLSLRITSCSVQLNDTSTLKYPVLANGSTSGTYANSKRNFPNVFTIVGNIHNNQMNTDKQIIISIGKQTYSGGISATFRVSVSIAGSTVSTVNNMSIALPTNNTLSSSTNIATSSGSFSLTETVMNDSGSTKNVTKTYYWGLSIHPFGDCLFSGGSYNPSTSIPAQASLRDTVVTTPTDIANCVWGVSLYIKDINTVTYNGSTYTLGATINPYFASGTTYRISNTYGGIFYLTPSSRSISNNDICINILIEKAFNSSSITSSTGYTKWCLGFNLPIQQEPNLLEDLTLDIRKNPITYNETTIATCEATYTSGTTTSVTSSTTFTANPSDIVDIS